MKPLNRKDRRHLLRLDVSKAFLHTSVSEPTLFMYHKIEGTGVQSKFGKDGKMGD
jgi:hypothetical protein